MAESKLTKRYMELQLEELGQELEDKKERAKRVKQASGDPKDKEIADLYADSWEYEQELAYYERIVETIRGKTPAQALEALTQNEAFDEDFEVTFQTIVAQAWQDDDTRAQLLKTVSFVNLSEALANTCGLSIQQAQKEIMECIVSSYETAIEIKKEHIKEESDYIKALGLKPHYAKRVYKRYHGIE